MSEIGRGTDRPGADGRPWPSLAQAIAVWTRIAALSFGGPAGQIAVMHRILVEEKRWLGDRRFLHALNFCMLLPGPEAQQLTVYIGWLMHGRLGGLIAGTLFVLPGAISILALSIVYALYGDVAFVAGLFFGLKAAVLAIVAQAILRLGRRILGHRAAIAMAVAAFLAIFLLGLPFPLIVAAAGLTGWLVARSGSPAFGSGGHGGSKIVIADAATILGDGDDRRVGGHMWGTAALLLLFWLGPVAGLVALSGPDAVFADIALFFSKLAVVTFGGAYAVLAYVAQAAVENYGWLQPGEMLDGLGLAETTPGPLIMVVQFVGFLAAFRDPGPFDPVLAGTLGALLTLWVTFLPCFLWIFLGAPYVETLRGNTALAGALSAITAAVVGVIANLALWFALHALFAQVGALELGPVALPWPDLASLNPAMAVLVLAALVAAFRFRLGTGPLLTASALSGLVLELVGWS